MTKRRKKDISLTLMRWKNWVDYLEYAEQSRTEKQNYKSSWREHLLYRHQGQGMYGYMAVSPITLAITNCHHSASLLMPISDPRD